MSVQGPSNHASDLIDIHARSTITGRASGRAKEVDCSGDDVTASMTTAGYDGKHAACSMQRRLARYRVQPDRMIDR